MKIEYLKQIKEAIKYLKLDREVAEEAEAKIRERYTVQVEIMFNTKWGKTHQNMYTA